MKVPVVHYWPGSAEEGALISFQVDVEDNFRRAAFYLSLIHISEPTRPLYIAYAVFCLKKIFF